MAKDYQAVRPDKYFSSLPSVIKDEEAKKKGVTEEERALAALSESMGWNILTGYIDNLVDDLDDVSGRAISDGATFEEIGRNTLVINLAKGIIKKIMDKVTDAKEICEEQPKGSKGE